jgi:hypothetical protein
VVGHNIYITGRLFAYFLALKDPRMVVGYSGPEVDLALLRGEVDARSSLIASIVQRTPEVIALFNKIAGGARLPER